MSNWQTFIRHATSVALGNVMGSLIVSALIAAGIWPYMVAITFSFASLVWGLKDGLPPSEAFVLMLGGFAFVLMIIAAILAIKRRHVEANTSEVQRSAATDGHIETATRPTFVRTRGGTGLELRGNVIVGDIDFLDAKDTSGIQAVDNIAVTHTRKKNPSFSGQRSHLNM